MVRKPKDVQGESPAAALAGQGGSVPQLEMVPLARLRESPTNPRSRWNDIEELAASIRAEGLLHPIVVRPLPGVTEWPDVEIVAGARRFRAVTLLGWSSIPATVHRIDVKGAISKQLTENKHREDIHPLDETKLFDVALQNGWDVPSLAKQLGRDESYVYHRLQIGRLIQPWREIYTADRIHFGHALVICRLQEQDQKDLLDTGGLLGESGPIHMSVVELRLYVEQTYLLNLETAAFNTADPRLVEAAGACTTCSKRTGYNQVLWPEMAQRDTCTDKTCFAAKIAAHADHRQAQLQRDGLRAVKVSTSYVFKADAPEVLLRDQYREISTKEADSLPPAEVKTAIVTDGPQAGKEILVHVPPPPPASEPAEPAVAVEDRQRIEQKARRQQAINRAVLHAIAGKAKVLRSCDWRKVVEFLWNVLSVESQQVVCEYYGWQEPENAPHNWTPFDGCDQWSAANWQRLCLLLTLAEHVPVYGIAGGLPDPLKDAARHFEVDVAAARKQAAEDLKASEAEA